MMLRMSYALTCLSSKLLLSHYLSEWIDPKKGEISLKWPSGSMVDKAF